jgi:hypothetical protein
MAPSMRGVLDPGLSPRAAHRTHLLMSRLVRLMLHHREPLEGRAYCEWLAGRGSGSTPRARGARVGGGRRAGAGALTASFDAAIASCSPCPVYTPFAILCARRGRRHLQAQTPGGRGVAVFGRCHPSPASPHRLAGATGGGGLKST